MPPHNHTALVWPLFVCPLHRVAHSPITLLIVLGLGLSLWLGCDGVVDVVPGPAVELQVTPAGTSISGVGATATFSVEAWDADGTPLPSPTVTWSSLNPHVATIDEGGTATALASGQVTIVAEVDGRVGYALLTVSTPEVGPVTSWTVMAPPAVPLWDVWSTSPSDVFAVGSDGFILHYDGTEWSAMTSGASPYLFAVWGSSSTDVYTVGINGTILHYDGTSCSSMTSGTTDLLWAVWGRSSSDVYAVGGYGIIVRGIR
ncbi:MAG: hypothetical protein GTO22_07780 [Gemmatimonadales bacterium]|nr:hypothetical protein [Gemmatimonadales bacterium]